MNREEYKNIRKIVQIGGHDEEGNWVGSGVLGVFFKDDKKYPLQYQSPNEIAVFWADYAQAYGYGNDAESISQFMQDVYNGKVGDVELSVADTSNAKNSEAFLKEVEEANKNADAYASVTGDELDQVEDFAAEGGVKAKRLTKENVMAAVGGLAAVGTAIGAVGYTANQVLNQQNVDDDVKEDSNTDSATLASTTTTSASTIDYDSATFDEIMDAMDDSDARKIVAETAMELVTTFNEQTHKDDNFRLEEDAETYLDLSYEEALMLTVFANYSEPVDIYEVLGDYSITSEEAQDLLESAQEKIITYYMNAKEPSGVANIFFNEEDKAFFENFESEVIEFNTQHDNTTSDQVIRDVYYYYLLNGSTNYTNVNPLAKVLAYDTVYGGLTLTESASTEHTGYLVFQGFQTEDGKFDEEAETKYYVENILNLDYNSLTDEEKETYRTNIIESSTELVKLLETGETMTEDNSTTDELNTAEVSIEDLVNNQGLCNEAYSELQEAVQSLNTMKAVYAFNTTQSTDLSLARKTLAESLYAEGLDELAEEVEASTGSLSDDLLTRISSASSNGESLVSTYSKLSNRPTMEQIVNAANNYLATLENYNVTSMDALATLINNRRHTVEYSYEADENGYYGTDEDGIPIYDSSVLDGMTDEEIEEFIIENGTVISEETSTTTEEVTYDSLTDEEKASVDAQKESIVAEFTVDNTEAAAAKSANNYANSSSYTFSPSTVTNDANGEVYNLNSMTFANGVSYLYAFGGKTVSTSDSQIQAAASNAADNYISSLSSEEQSACQAYYGSSWKSSLKNVYVNAYLSQMSSEISTAVSVGKEMRATTDAIIAEVENLNENQENTNSSSSSGTTGDTTSSESSSSEVEEEENTETTTETSSATDDTEITEGEEEVKEDTNTNTSSSSDTSANEEEEIDQTEIHVEEGEVQVEDANGNSVDSSSTSTSANEEESSVSAQSTSSNDTSTATTSANEDESKSTTSSSDTSSSSGSSSNQTSKDASDDEIDKAIAAVVEESAAEEETDEEKVLSR